VRDGPEGEREPSARIVGREPEVAALSDFLGDPALKALVLWGEPGIGKTTLWEAGIDAARRRRMRVLSARPSGAETQLSFATLADLLDPVDLDAAGLPPPQLRALKIALLRSEPRGKPPEPRAIDLGFLNALRALAARRPLLVAIDDVQWLDRPSADALAFAARRLEGDPVRFLLTRRSRGWSALERALKPRGLERFELGPLSLGATRRILHDRLGLSLPRRVLSRIFESARGNPLFALELGRTLAEREPPEIGVESPLPDIVEDLLGTRVARLPGRMRRLLLAVALSADPRASQLGEIVDPVAIDDAVDAGLLLVDGDRVRPSHPLLAAAARRHSRARERRELHLELARSVAEEELRARHLALATARPDAELAALAAAAARTASARGAAEEAVELAEHALRLTPPESAERTDRLLALAEYLVVAGSPQQVTDLLSPELGALPRGPARARAHLLLSDGGAVTHVDDYQHHLDQALAESEGDAALRATVLARQTTSTAVARVERIRDAEAWALEALPAACDAGPETERLVLHALGWARILRGQDVDDLSERFRAASDDASHLYRSLDRVAAVRLVWRGDVSKARAILIRLLSRADERGEALSYANTRLHLCELELRAGGWAPASELLDEWDEPSERVLVVAPAYERCRALLGVGRGILEEAKRWTAAAMAGVEATGVRWDMLEALRARGIAALFAHEPERAAESLRAVWAHAQREGVDDPGAFPVAPDLVEALVELGELDEAPAVINRLRDTAEAQEHPWGLASAKRCDALVRLASQPYDEEAAAALAQAAARYEELGLRFDRARSLLVLGRAQRRHKKWAAARDSLEQAAAAFEEIGSAGWAEQARSELARVGARRPQPSGELTEAERRAVELAAEGHSNKEIAQTLFVSVHTVEVHLSHAYAKLGVRSRAQLARRLSAEA
jgi:DNA-binding CsgD family transcriptional regulator